MGGNELTTFIDSKQVVYGIGNKETQNFTKWQKSGVSCSHEWALSIDREIRSHLLPLCMYHYNVFSVNCKK